MSGELIRFLEKVGAKTRFGQNAHTLCGATSKRTGFPCRQPAMKNGRCRLHGGKTPKGKERETPTTKREWQRKLKAASYKTRRAERYALKQLPQVYNWETEQALLNSGLLHKATDDIVRAQLRHAYTKYNAGEMPWLMWHNTLEHLGLA